ncbi:hypothetical protein [Microcoleus sp. A006_D1]
MNSLILTSPSKGSGFKPILSGKLSRCSLKLRMAQLQNYAGSTDPKFPI